MDAPERTFLGEVAAALYAKYGEEVSSLSLLFPSRRARLFFSDELARVANRPLWEPEWLSIDRLMEELSGLHTGDRLRLIVELYRIYTNYHDEDFDRFYFWGETLLSDFDMVDKYRIDAAQLFRNIYDLKELEADLSYLTEEQQRIIRSFWEGVFSESERSGDSKERQRFLRIWNSLGAIYTAFRKRLMELGFAYTGLLQREAADRLLAGQASVDRTKRYVVAGFNALSECEKVLFDHLQRAGAEFFWDCDSYYVERREQEAGMFLRENLRRFPEALGSVTRDNMLRDKEFKVVSTASNAAQCKYVGTLLNDFRKRDDKGHLLPLDKRTAIVLTDENLLMPLLYSLGEYGDDKQTGANKRCNRDKVNVTMGFPLKQSTAYTFVERLLELQAHVRRQQGLYAFYHADVTGILAHPYLNAENRIAGELLEEIRSDRRITVPAALLARNDLMRTIFAPVAGWQELSDYLLRVLERVGLQASEAEDRAQRIAFLSMIAEEITKLRNSVEECEIDIDNSTYTSLLRRHLQSLRIPFEGEPLDGIQVMGILETRNLDFENVILLSMTDDNFPGKVDSRASYIPYNLRAAYGLPTPEHHEGVYSYYFYRLIQRASRVVMCYCSHADDKSTGEPSRYIRQIEYESNRPIRFSEVGIDVNLPDNAPIQVAKKGRVRAALERYLQSDNPLALSPTAFSRYIACPLKFYFASVAHLREKEDITEDIDNPVFGNILHASMQSLYERIRGVADPLPLLEDMAKSDAVERTVTRVIDETLYGGRSVPEQEYAGNVLFVRDIVVRYIREGIIPYDVKLLKSSPFVVEGLEQQVDCDFPFDTERRVRFGGKADRIDLRQDSTLRVVDYKTGGVHLEFSGLDDLFVSKNRGLNGNIFQTLLYSLILWHRYGRDARPALYYVRQINRPDFSPGLVDKTLNESDVRYSNYRNAFEEALRCKLTELFDFTVPFRPCEEPELCMFCDFKAICRR